MLSIRSPVRPLVVSACGIGLAGAIADSIKDIKARRTAEIEELADSVLNRYQQVREQLFAASNMLNDPKAENPAGEIRATVNDLLMRLMIVMVTMAKGTGYMTNHSAQRLAREALFYLVWSARNPVQAATLRRILGNQTD